FPRLLPLSFFFPRFGAPPPPDAGDVWIDATRSRERAPLHAREPLPFRYGLPVHAGGGLVEIPAPKPALPDVEVTQRIRLHASGGEARALFGVVTDYRRGEAEDRRVQYEDSARGDIGERYLSYMRSFYDGIAAAGRPDAAEPPAPGVMRTVEGYRLDWNLQRDGQAFGIVLFQLGDWLPTLAQGTRTAPRLLAGPQYATHTIRVDYPRGWSITPGEDRVENPWFTFERRVDVEGDDLVVSGSWRRHADDVPAADYARFRTDMERARDLLAYQVDLDATPAVFSARAADWAWPAAATVALAALLGLAWRRRRRDRLSGMLFAPRPTMATLLQRPRAWWPALALMALTAVLGAAPDFVDESLGGNLVLAIVSLVSSLAWFPLYTLLLMGCLRMLSVRAGYGNLLLAAAWACVPYLLFLLLAGMALGGRIEVFADGHEMQPSDLPGVLLAVLLVLTGLCWSLVTSVNAGAVAASTGRAKMFGAFALSFLFLVGLALVVGLVAAVVYFSRGGVL
ncbi:Yip1 family protein, partial [Luteimonas sp. MJ204]|uniref:Yip1 family protein n=1 Tax=Luteimonas sp. MJ145 TaxID=3129234 RepID=UPI0031BBC52F